MLAPSPPLLPTTTSLAVSAASVAVTVPSVLTSGLLCQSTPSPVPVAAAVTPSDAIRGGDGVSRPAVPESEPDPSCPAVLALPLERSPSVDAVAATAAVAGVGETVSMDVIPGREEGCGWGWGGVDVAESEPSELRRVV